MNYLFKLSLLLLLLPLFFILIGLYFYSIKFLVFGLFLIFFLFYFHRVPKMSIIPMYKDPIVSPTYGTISNIEKFGDYTRIIIRLSLFNPHVQYVPYDGIVRKKLYIL